MLRVTERLSADTTSPRAIVPHSSREPLSTYHSVRSAVIRKYPMRQSDYFSDWALVALQAFVLGGFLAVVIVATFRGC